MRVLRRCRTRAFAIGLCAILDSTNASDVGAQSARSELGVDAIEAQVRAANGVLPKTERVTTSFVRNGISGSEVRIRAGDDYRIDTTFGASTTAEGSLRGVAWTQDQNGEVVVDSAEPDEPVVEPVTTTVSHVREPFERYTISRLTPLGYGTRETIDPATWHVVKSETIEPGTTETIRFSDFAGPLGYVRAWHRTTSDGHPENDTSYTVTSDVEADVAPAMLAIPPSRPLVVFPRGRNAIELPARLNTHRDRFIVRVTIGTRGLDFLLDTGSSGIVIDHDVLRSLGARENDVRSSGGNAARYESASAIVPEMDVGDLVMRDAYVSTVPRIGIDEPGVKVVGLLGFDFLAGIAAELDYRRGIVTAYDGAMPVNAGLAATTLDLHLGDHVPEVSAALDGAVGTRFVLDSGGIGATLVFGFFERRYPSALADVDDRPRRRTLRGAGGNFDAELLRIDRMTVGAAQFRNVNAFVVATSSAYAGDYDGTIGPDILRQFTVILDYPHRRAILLRPPT